jgi:hypothetical protein
MNTQGTGMDGSGKVCSHSDLPYTERKADRLFKVKNQRLVH